MSNNKVIDSNLEKYPDSSVEESGLFSLKNIIDILILHWPWFIVSLVICLGVTSLYLKTVTPKYVASAKILIKEDESTSSRSKSKFAAIMSAENLGTISNSAGIDNELEILTSRSVVEDAVKELKLFTSYSYKGRFRNQPIYKYQPLVVDVDSATIADLDAPIQLSIERKGSSYQVKGKYIFVYKDDRPNEKKSINTTIKSLPATINTKVGNLSINNNPERIGNLEEGKELLVTISPLSHASVIALNNLSAEQTGKQTSIARLTYTDVVPERATDFLEQLSISYNAEANLDKNIVAIRTEEFINSRLEKINAELGETEGQLENYKRQNNVIRLDVNSTNALQQTTQYEQKMNDVTTQIMLLSSMLDFMNSSSSNLQPLPTNVGITDPAALSLIQKYNDAVLYRSHIMKSASANNQVVQDAEDNIANLSSSIRQAITQAYKNLVIQKNNLSKQYSKYNGEVGHTPSQERILTQIGREQEVRSGLYLMLLQKREENSISLSATADKGKLIDKPAYGGQVSPKKNMILMIGFAAGLGLPLLFFILLQLLRYKIEDHEDVVKMTKVPVIADIAVASEAKKQKADIVVRENSNTQIEEIFRSLRTNLQFTMKGDANVIMLTSSMSGEGKTFIAANLAVSYALLGKKVILIGLDIRKPRLAELFQIKNHHNGITTLLAKDEISMDDINREILPSGVHDRLDLLMAGIIPPNPAELVARPSLEKIINELKHNYDIVVIDTAPVGLVTDTLQIGKVSDATIFVCRADYTPKSCFAYINELFAEHKLPNMSLVINGIDMSKKKYSYHYGYGRYGKYGRYGHRYGNYGTYGRYGVYGNSVYGRSEDDSIKK